MTRPFLPAVACLLLAAPAMAQVAPQASIAEMATTPLVKLQISETLRTPPDEASITVGTQVRAPTATQASAESKAKTERLLATIRRAGIRERDTQTQGIQLQPEYQWIAEPAGGRGRQVFQGYVATNSIQIKTRDIDRLTGLLDTLTTAGADSVYGPNFSIADPLPLRAEARRRALVRAQSEALEYARAQGFTRVTLLSVEEGTSHRGTEVIVSGNRLLSADGAPPPPPPAPERGGGDGIVAPGLLETGVSLNLIYRMER
ncbi:SIMPL domain-containing protein [Sphingomonas sp. LHG3406-1]|uniref:SIMPL domain-containing protein n=1 Tax=Sphingomonas sp. LHG3406-1 TaxID=2804617 RepID=UPI00261F02E2|nr:SIMPL domain-containing protein [Sphingomonas sp. LHG3406-1]